MGDTTISKTDKQMSAQLTAVMVKIKLSPKGKLLIYQSVCIPKVMSSGQ